MRLAVIALAVSSLGLLVLALAGPAHRLGMELPAAFALLRWGASIGAAGAAVAIAGGAMAWHRRARLQLLASAAALAAGLTAVAIPWIWQQRTRSAPPIYDISTDLENPPTFEAIVPLRADAPNPLDRPPHVAEQQRQGYPDLAPITLPVPRDQAFDRALVLAQRLGWEIVGADKSSGRIEATDTSFWFGFKDDIVIRLTPWGAGTRVDVRSVSRIGRNDAGANARRIRDFLDQMQAE
ncbi:MAG TPA: DUF1499 domain-containing protein [Vicinamibacterales bacterium]|nr:DUF1499 domain-containing protein [Vicinamibacterales bacterium]